MPAILYEVFGWIGTGLVVAAYFLNSTNRLDSTGRIYAGMNFLGALGVGLNVLNSQAWPALALQIIWGVVAITSLLGLNTKRSPKTSDHIQ